MKQSIRGTLERPRLYIFRSNKHIYAQIIDDTQNKILLAKSSLVCKSKDHVQKYATCATSMQVGKLIAEDCLQRGITQVVFDRGNKLYHGRIKALAESARQAGIKF